VSDAIARIDRRLTVDRLRAEIGAPCAASGPDGLRQLLTDPIRPLQAAEIGTLAGPGAGHKETHICLLRRGAARREHKQSR